MESRNTKRGRSYSSPTESKPQAIQSNLSERTKSDQGSPVTESEMEWTGIIVPFKVWFTELDRTDRLKYEFNTISHFAEPLAEAAYLWGYKIGFQAAKTQMKKSSLGLKGERPL